MKLILVTIPILIMTSCSFFEAPVQTCEEIQEYQSSVSIPQLLLPQALIEIQKRSSFDMSDLSTGNSISREDYLPILEDLPETSPIKNISGDDLSELLDLIDETIDGRNNIATQNQIISKVSQNVDSNRQIICLEESPNYFSEGLPFPRKDISKEAIDEDESSWWQRIRERRSERKAKRSD
ncbi:MAG: hypothetical protein Ct9H90mP13_01690 [Pseudomonadota bacterium]|nr:MAG: hypothetical protein Ct9H90mP13_01690 [Pseudomonadota bacterium]